MHASIVITEGGKNAEFVRAYRCYPLDSLAFGAGFALYGRAYLYLACGRNHFLYYLASATRKNKALKPQFVRARI